MSRVHVVDDRAGEIIEYALLPSEAEQRELVRIWKAIVLSPSLGICQALLRGERVPLSWLAQKWVERLGVKA